MWDELADGIYERLLHDRSLTIDLTVFFTVMLIVSVVAGIAIWPVVIASKGSVTPYELLCDRIFTVNLILLGVYVVLVVLLVLFSHGYRFVNAVLVSAGVGTVVNFVVLLMSRGLVVEMVPPGFATTLLWTIVSVFLAWTLSLVPCMAASLVGKLVHSVFCFFNHDAMARR